MRRFVVIATTRRGAMRRPKLLDDEGQSAALSQWRQDESREARAEWELDAMNRARSACGKKPVESVRDERAERLMELSAIAGRKQG